MIETDDAPPEGYHYEWAVDDDWIADGEGRVCRQPKCGRLAWAKFARTAWYKETGRKRVWWHYCDKHLYGRRIRDGRVEIHRLVANTADALQAAPESDLT